MYKTSFLIALVESKSLFSVKDSLVSIYIKFVHILYYKLKVKDSCKLTLNEVIKIFLIEKYYKKS